jgi:hypothetical protein
MVVAHLTNKIVCAANGDERRQHQHHQMNHELFNNYFMVIKTVFALKKVH